MHTRRHVHWDPAQSSSSIGTWARPNYGFWSPKELRVGCCSLWRQWHSRGPKNVNWYELSWKSPFLYQDLAPHNSLQVPALEILRPNNQQGNTIPYISMQAAKNHTKLTATQTVHLTWPSHQRDKTLFHSPEPGTSPSYQKVSLTKGQTLEAKEATILHRAERRPQTES